MIHGGNGMKVKKKIKLLTDFLLTVILLALMAYQITGEKLHECFGVSMLLLFVIHNILNIRWYKSLCRGNYGYLRILWVSVNFAVLLSILSLAYSGIIMSRHVFAFLPIKKGMALARTMHLSSSYWGFTLMSMHLGLHWGMVVGMFGRLSGKKRNAAFWWGLRLLAVFIAGYGALCFYKADILSYMLLRATFAFLDYDKPAAVVLIEYLSMMGLWVFITYYVTKLFVKILAGRRKGEERG